MEFYKKQNITQKWKWINVVSITLFHIISVYAFFEVLLFSSSFTSLLLNSLWIYLVGNTAGLGVTAGAHRLWCHRTYKAKAPLRVFLSLCYSIAGQNNIYDWVRDHRIHHKYSDTDADPHNATRGFWFSHVGWLYMTKHPDVIAKGHLMNMNDVKSDPVVKWHTKNFILLKILLCFLLPTLVPVYCWSETWRIAILSQMFVRYCVSLNFTWFVNSAAHIWGTKPFDKNINPSENKFVAIAAIGEGWHNYHHTFPYDYKAAELHDYYYNFTTMFIDFCAYFGWAYDLKQPSKEAILKTVQEKGDDSYNHNLQ